jgi:MinD superfamily P-loop ATPase
MKTIAVTGGKGGTGKSTIALLLAIKAIDKGLSVTIVDADVECPNDYILLNRNSLGSSILTVKVPYPKIDLEKCNRCGKCVKLCRANAIITKKDGTPIIQEDLCSSCGVCWNICPQNAINKTEKIVGNIYKQKISENLTLITGQSLVGLRETSSVVSSLREYTKNLPCDLLVIDTAAGSHCTVMRALENVDYAYAITEPTPLGRHDLRVILRVLKKLRIPNGIILNQYDNSDQNLILEVAKEFGINVEGRVPYSKELAQYYSSGQLLNMKNINNLLKIEKEFWL